MKISYNLSALEKILQEKIPKTFFCILVGTNSILNSSLQIIVIANYLKIILTLNVFLKVSRKQRFKEEI